MYTSLDRVKKHLNLDDYFEEDNDYIVHLISAAEDATAKRLNIPDLSRVIDPTTGYLPESIVHQILLLVGTWYASRETFAYQTVNKIPHTFDFLADLNKSYKSTF